MTMDGLQIFQNPEFGSIRTILIDDEPWFVGKDVAISLGYKNTSDAIAKHVDDEDKKMGSQNATPPIADSFGRVQYATWINESGLYCLILSSKLPSAKKFKRWVTSEVLPSLRKEGVYALPQAKRRDLTTDDYMKAAQIVACCRNERLPYVLNFLQNAGFAVPELQAPQIIEDDGVDIVGLLNKYSLSELCDKLNLSKSTLYYYRIGKYKPQRERRKYIIETLE